MQIEPPKRQAMLEEIAMFCANCGAKIPEGAHFCPDCGEAADGAISPRGKPAATAAPLAQPGVEKPKMALWKKILIGVVVFIAGVVGLAYFATSGLDAPVERHLSALAGGNVEAAYAETSVAFQQSTSLEQYKAFVERYPVLKNISGHTFLERTIENGVGTLKGKLTTPDGGVVPVEFKLVKENDAWKILGISLGSG